MAEHVASLQGYASTLMQSLRGGGTLSADIRGARKKRFGLITSSMVLAYWAFYILFFGGALCLLAGTSLHVYEWGSPTPGVDLDNFKSLVRSSTFADALYRSVGVSLAVAAFSALIGLLTVLGVFSIRSRRIRLTILLGTGMLFFSGAIPRTVAAQFLLSGSGPFGELMFGSEQRGLLYSISGIILGYLPLMLPPTVLALFVAREAVPKEVIDAATDLSAGWWVRHVRVVIPLMRPGLVLALLLPFVLTLGDVVVIDLIGGSHVYTAALVILDYVKIDDWGRAAAAALSLLFLAIIALSLASWGLGLRWRR